MGLEGTERRKMDLQVPETQKNVIKNRYREELNRGLSVVRKNIVL